MDSQSKEEEKSTKKGFRCLAEMEYTIIKEKFGEDVAKQAMLTAASLRKSSRNN